MRSKIPEEERKAKRRAYDARLYADPVRAEKRKTQARDHYKANREAKIARATVYSRERRQRDPAFRARLHMRSRFSLLITGNSDRGLTESLGCSVEQLRAYISDQFKSGMSWDNYGEWHIDHKRPLSSFPLEQLADAFHYTNLQPLWAVDNLIKGSKIGN